MVDVATDACQMAAAGYFWGDWFYQHFLLDSPASDPLHIAHKETLAMVLAAKRWGRKWSNCCDSSKWQHIISKGTTASAVIMQEHRALFWLSPTYKFQINDVYFEGAKNTITNSISCLHKRKGLFSFYLITCKAFSPAFANAIPLATHMSIHSNASFLADPQAPVLPAQQNLGDPHQYLRKKTTGARDRLSSHGSYQIFFGGWGGGKSRTFWGPK